MLVWQVFRALPDAAPQGDGVENLLKHAFNLNGRTADTRMLAPGETGGLPIIALKERLGAPKVSIEYLRRKGSGLIYQPMISNDLITFRAAAGDAMVSAVDAVWERVVLEHPLEDGDEFRWFARVMVALP